MLDMVSPTSYGFRTKPSDKTYFTFPESKPFFLQFRLNVWRLMMSWTGCKLAGPKKEPGLDSIFFSKILLTKYQDKL